MRIFTIFTLSVAKSTSSKPKDMVICDRGIHKQSKQKNAYILDSLLCDVYRFSLLDPRHQTREKYQRLSTISQFCLSDPTSLINPHVQIFTVANALANIKKYEDIKLGKYIFKSIRISTKTIQENDEHAWNVGIRSKPEVPRQVRE